MFEVYGGNISIISTYFDDDDDETFPFAKINFNFVYLSKVLINSGLCQEHTIHVRNELKLELKLRFSIYIIIGKSSASLSAVSFTQR